VRSHHLPILALSVLLGFALPAASQERGQRFLDLMSNLLPELWTNRSQAIPEFFDFEVAAGVVESLAGAHPGKVDPGAKRILGGPFVMTSLDPDWGQTVGFTQGDLRAAVTVQVKQEILSVLLLNTEVMNKVGPALLANGYTQSGDRGFPAFWRLADDFAFDMELRNSDDPFAADVPISSRIALEGDVLLHAHGWPGLESLVADHDQSPVLDSFASALNMPDWGERQLVQAIVFSDPVSFSPGFRIADGLTPVETPSGAVPYWSNMMLADLSDGASDLTLLVLLYAAKSDAESAAGALEAGFQAAALPSYDNKTLGEVVGAGTATVLGEGPYLAIYAVQTEPDIRSETFLSNRGYRILSRAASMRELYLLGPKLR
jgi:hypothetical protein